MSAHQARHYFVRVRGRVQGPFELSRLKVLRARGQFSRVFEVSEDGHNWVSSESLAELLDPVPLPAPELIEFSDPQPDRSAGNVLVFEPPGDPWDDQRPRRRRKPESNLGTILLIVLLIIVPAAIVGGVLLYQRLEQEEGFSEPDEPDPAERANNSGSPLEALLRGAGGDPFSKAFELKSLQVSAIRKQADFEGPSVPATAALTADDGRQFS
ncbi:MAG TPA: hypothetical protein VM510_10985 [Caulifigura sp.]|jgi:hypothetical protein|nr:hypothetical protein [Caulifigura sp.]